MSAKQFLSSTTTKDELTVYLAKKALYHFEGKPKIFIVTSRQNVYFNCMDVQHLHSSQEQADTRVILHRLDAARREATVTFSHLIQMCLSSQFDATVSLIPLGPIVHALGTAKAAALPGFHAFSGTDVTGRFAGKGKLNCQKALSRCSEEVVSAFAALGTSEELSVNTVSAIEAFVCQLYESGTKVVDVGDLRWKIFGSQWSSGSTLACCARGPRFESRCGQKFVFSRKPLQYAALGMAAR